MGGVWFWVFVGPALVLAAVSLRGEGRRLDWVRTRLNALQRSDWPQATVIVPVKGHDEGLAENLGALASLDYSNYELIVAARLATDIPPGVVPPGARVVLAGASDPDTGEKIANLLAAVAAARPESTVLAFADSDGRPQPGWLKALVLALDQPEAAAATGYRWYFPKRPSSASLARSLWNAIIAGGFGPGAPFAWGGATAIRREDFAALRIADYWRGHVSDDWRLTHAVRDSGRRIAFAPGAMVAARDSTGWSGFLEWATRQLILTRVHEPKLWSLSAFATTWYCASMVVCIRAGLEGNPVGPLCLAAQIGAGTWKSWSRLRLARVPFPEESGWLRRWGWSQLALVAPVTWVWLYTHAASAFRSTIRWRGNRYRLSRAGAKRL